MNKFWSALSEREIILISICGVSIALFVIYMFVITPISQTRESSRNALEAQKKSYARIVALASEAARSDSTQNIIEHTPIREAATEASRTVGVAISRIQPGNDNRVTFWIDEANTQEISRWLLMLKEQYGWNVTKLSLNKNTNSETLRGQFEFGGAEQ